MDCVAQAGDAGSGGSETTRLREARLPEDAKQVAELIRDGFRMEPSAAEEMVRREVGSPDIRYLIEHEGEAVGQLAARRNGDTAFIYGFCVLSGLRGRGIGRAALAEALDKLKRKHGCSRFRLEVAAANDRALGLYESAGFRTTNTVDYYKKFAE